MYTALYRAYRPEVFDEILGQEHIVKILKNQIATDSTSHAYLFCGTRGTGKTTTARILAKGLNCIAEEGGRPCGRCSVCRSIKEGTYLDVIEIDAASNNGVDNIRELRESIKYPPASGRKKSLYNRRGPHAVFGGVQCAAQDAGGAAGIRGVHTGDYGAAEAAGNDTVKVYET
mgnify:CR=1 FL=1